MKISECISALQELAQDHGDMEVYVGTKDDVDPVLSVDTDRFEPDGDLVVVMDSVS